MYIRTKDCVYEVKENMTIEKGVFSFFGKIYDTTEKHLFKNDKDLGEVVKQSENLEELCDQIVCGGILYQNKITRAGCCCLVEDNFEELEEPITGGMLKEGIYGAIWTDKGLIYVAKLNDKGELELI